MLAAATLCIASNAWAQVDTAAIRGSINAADGMPIGGVEVTLVHEPSGNQGVTLTNGNGEFAFTGLRVGGPYTVTAIAPGFLPRGASRIFLTAGKIERVSLTLQLASEQIVIEGSAPTPANTSPRTVFGSRDISELPSIGRDPKDLARLTPEVYIDGEAQAMSIGGTNNRFNSITIDGIRQNDDFGLNDNGYPTQRSPISLDAIEEIAVETSPFDVRYGNFLGGNINIVTKSGTNEFHGSVFGAFVNDRLTGSRTGDDELDIEFRDMRYGLNLGGPVVKDEVHFFLSVEGLTATTPVSVGAAGSGAAFEVTRVTQAEVERARAIARDVYGFAAGEPGRSLDENDLKLLAKVDWAIGDRHRLSAKYQRAAGNIVREAIASDTTLPLTSSWYDRIDTLDAFALRLYSSWTSSLSTTVELMGKLVDTRQEPLNGSDFMSAEIATADGGSIILGPDQFRHANELDNDTLHVKSEANYLLQRHLFTGGWEIDRVRIVNLFVPASNGVAEYASLDAFEDRRPDSISYSNAVTNDPADGAANFGFLTHAWYLQDQFAITDQLTVQGGVRFELYQSDAGTIAENQNFIDRHGFSNTETLDGRHLLMPRLGLTYRPMKGLNLRGGVGLYSGGTPNVWISNNYTNNGVTIDTSFSDDPAVIDGFDGYQVPQALQDELTPGDGNVDALDPGFEVPSTWKAAAGIDYSLDIPGLGAAGRDIGLTANYTYSKVRHGIMWTDLRRDLASLPGNMPVGTLPDGRPYYDNDGSDGTLYDSRRGYDMFLTNTDKGYGHTLSVAVDKRFSSGLQLYGAYAFQKVQEITPATSSRAVSNYGQMAVADPNDPDLGTSNYERAHRIIGALRLSRPLLADLIGASNQAWKLDSGVAPVWKDLDTSIAIFFEARSGQPYSYTFGDSTRGDTLAQLFGEDREFARRNRQLFYVPTGRGDDVILDGISEAELDAFLESTGLDRYRGQIAPRNAFRGPWVSRVDLRIAQALPTPVSGHRAKLYIDIQNLGNLLNSDWGRADQVHFPFIVPVADVNVDPATGRYVYSNLRTAAPEQVNLLASIWRVQISLMYEF